jgi:hypothetical protein
MTLDVVTEISISGPPFANEVYPSRLDASDYCDSSTRNHHHLRPYYCYFNAAFVLNRNESSAIAFFFPEDEEQHSSSARLLRIGVMTRMQTLEIYELQDNHQAELIQVINSECNIAAFLSLKTFWILLCKVCYCE